MDEPKFIKLKVELDFGPDANPEIYSLEIDQVSWITIISNALGKFYGLVGQALFYEINDINGRSCVIKVYEQDEKVFINSFFTYKFKFNNIYGGTIENECYVKYLESVRSM